MKFRDEIPLIDYFYFIRFKTINSFPATTTIELKVQLFSQRLRNSFIVSLYSHVSVTAVNIKRYTR